MGFFDDEDFGFGGIGDIFRRLAEGGANFEEYAVDSDGKRKVVRRKKSTGFGKSFLDQFETKNKIYFLFDFAGKKNLTADIADELVSNDYGEKVSTGKKVLQVKEGERVLAEFLLPKNLKKKDFGSVFTNGILEVSFRK